MSRRPSTWQKATALVPLALLSGAWTANLAVTSASASPDGAGTLPDGSQVPEQALEAPASVTAPGSLAPGVPAGAEQAVIANASANGIPAAALAAYQRAEQVIGSADRSCRLSWQLVAAIGRVESDHGRYGGNTLGDDGVARPGIYGIPLDGSNGTAEIKDSDAGQYDDDQVYDRAVGPMQFIPGTWSVVGVDADGDGQRNPQDIDDAALASAVYLCSGDEDLSTYGGQKAAVYRYNHSQEYVDLVISIMNAYLGGDYSSVPNGIPASTVFTPSYGDAVLSAATVGRGGGPKAGGNRPGGKGGGPGRGGGGTAPTGGGSDNGGGSGGDTGPVPSDPGGGGATDPVEETTKKVTDGAKKVKEKLDDTVKGGVGGGVTEPVEESLTKAEATAKCIASGISALDTAALDACIDDLMNP